VLTEAKIVMFFSQECQP